MRFLAIPFVLLAAAALPPRVPAAEAPVDKPTVVLTGRLSLEDAVKVALAQNRSLAAAMEERAIADSRVVEARSTALPTADLEGRYERLGEALAVELPGGERLNFGYLNNYSADLNVNQALWRGGAVSAALRAATFYRALTDANVRGAVQETVFAAARAYYDLTLAREQLKVAEDTVTLSETLLKDVEAKRRFGVASDFNVLRARVDLSNAKLARVLYQNALHRATADLMRTLGVSQSSEVELTEELRYVPTEVNEEEEVARALKDRPDLAASDFGVKLQKEAVSVARSDYFPKLDAYWSGRWARPDPVVSNINEWGNSWKAGVTLRFTVFDGFRRAARLARENALYRQRELKNVDAREQALFEVRNAVRGVGDAMEAVESQRLALDQATEGLRLAEVGYREGTLDQVSVLEARTALTQSRYFHLASLHAYLVARLNLQRATGTLVPSDGGK